jgi:hypothetical protein
MYWQIGRVILEEEQEGRERAGYGDFLIKSLSKIFTAFVRERILRSSIGDV